MTASRGVLVTGGSRGIGAATVRAFAALGDRVAVHCRSSVDLARDLVAELPGAGHVVVRGDVADPDAVADLVAQAVTGLGRIDVVVNNAAMYTDPPVAGSRRSGHPVAEVDYDGWVQAWRRTVEVNLLGPAHVSWCVVRHMLDVDPPPGRPRGRIVNVGSRGAFRGEPDVPAYGASKAGLHAMGQSLAQALAPHDIAVTSVAPGFVATDMAADILAGPGGAAVRAQSPFGRVAQPQEVAQAIVFLASDSATWSSGAVLDLNGASYLR